MKKLKISIKTIKTILAILIMSLVIIIAFVTDSKHPYEYRILFGAIIVIVILAFLHIFTMPEKEKKKEKTPMDWGNWAEAKPPEDEQKSSKRRFILFAVIGPIGTLIYSLWKRISKRFKYPKAFLVLVAIIAVTFMGCAKQVYQERYKHNKSQTQNLLKDKLSDVRTRSKPSPPRSSTFKSPDGRLQILFQTWIYIEMEDSYVLVTVRRLNEEGEVIMEKPLYNQKFSLKNLGEFYEQNERGYFCYLGENCHVSSSWEEKTVSFGILYPEETYKIKYPLSHLELSPIKTMNKSLAPEESRTDRKY